MEILHSMTASLRGPSRLLSAAPVMRSRVCYSHPQTDSPLLARFWKSLISQQAQQQTTLPGLWKRFLMKPKETKELKEPKELRGEVAEITQVETQDSKAIDAAVPVPANADKKSDAIVPTIDRYKKAREQWPMSSSGIWTPLSRRRHNVFWMQALQLSSAASPVSEKDGNSDSSVEETCVSGDEKAEPISEGKDEPVPEIDKEQAVKAEQEDKEALLNSIAQLEALLSEKNSQLVELKERAVTTKAELENVRIRAQRDADNTKKYAVQEFAKSLLDVADNLGRALTTIPANVRKELLTDQSETGKLLKSLVEGLIMTERELMKVLKKFGVEKFEPVGQQFDPNSHLALFEMADPSKEPGTVALVAKVGYLLHDRVLRPAEVGVVKSLE